jgi:hypothetical protein
MRLSGSKALVAVAVVFALSTLVHAADGVLVSQRMTVNGTVTTSQVQIEKTRMRAETSGATGKQVVLFDGARQVLDIVDMTKKTYMEMTKADFDQMAAQMKGMQDQVQQMMANMSPAQREQMEAMMRGRGAAMPAAPAKTEYRKTATDRVGKWTCQKYDSLQNGQKTGEICTVEPAALGFTLADFAVAQQLGNMFKALMPQAADQMFSVGRMEDQGFSGIPVRTISGTTTMEITDVARQTFPDSLFAVPAGFQKQDLMGAMGGRRGRGTPR